VSVIWSNSQKKTYSVYFIFALTSDQTSINVKDIQLTYQGINIIPKIVGATLQYQLPKQHFTPKSSGSIMVEILQNQQGTYRWQIGIIKG
jgi:hypothetical protein